MATFITLKCHRMPSDAKAMTTKTNVVVFARYLLPYFLNNVIPMITIRMLTHEIIVRS
jgi:hypothetical protein